MCQIQYAGTGNSSQPTVHLPPFADSTENISPRYSQQQSHEVGFAIQKSQSMLLLPSTSASTDNDDYDHLTPITSEEKIFNAYQNRRDGKKKRFPRSVSHSFLQDMSQDKKNPPTRPHSASTVKENHTNDLTQVSDVSLSLTNLSTTPPHYSRSSSQTSSQVSPRSSLSMIPENTQTTSSPASLSSSMTNIHGTGWSSHTQEPLEALRKILNTSSHSGKQSTLSRSSSESSLTLQGANSALKYPQPHHSHKSRRGSLNPISEVQSWTSTDLVGAAQDQPHYFKSIPSIIINTSEPLDENIACEVFEKCKAECEKTVTRVKDYEKVTESPFKAIEDAVLMNCILEEKARYESTLSRKVRIESRQHIESIYRATYTQLMSWKD